MSDSVLSTDHPRHLPAPPVESQFIVRTKLRIPRFARAPVARERLPTRLGEKLSPFTLVSAPPGFGKTTLVTQLAAAWPDAVAWFQIDRLDSDPRRFVAPLLAAVQEKIAAFGRDHLYEVLQREVGADQRDIVRFINAVSELDRNEFASRSLCLFPSSDSRAVVLGRDSISFSLVIFAF